MIALLAGTATLGIVVQAGILFLFWRRTGLHVRPDFRWRGVGLGQIGRLAGWTFLMVARRPARRARAVPGALAASPRATPASSCRRTPGCSSCSRTRSSCCRSGRRTSRSSASTPRRAATTTSAPTSGAASAPSACSSWSRPPPSPSPRFPRRGSSPTAPTRPSPRPRCCCASSSASSRSPCCSSCSARSTPTTTPARRSSSRSCSACSSSPPRSSLPRRCPSHLLAAGVALGQSISSLIQVIVATWLLHRRLGGLRIGSWMLSLGRFALAAVPAAGAGWLTFLLLGGVEGWTVVGQAPRRARHRHHRRRRARSSTSAFLALLRAPELGSGPRARAAAAARAVADR